MEVEKFALNGLIGHVTKFVEDDDKSVMLHGNMDQKERDVIIKEFRSESSCVLITNDLSSAQSEPRVGE